MKRSEINQIVIEAKNFFADQKFFLPVWSSWKPVDWKDSYAKCYEIVDNMLGWDITDFGSGEFAKRGLVLFTIRNGNYQKKDKLYCEKIMKVDENQETPLHFHWNKSEDIINRGGGNLVLELYKATEQEELSDEDVTVSIDGVETIVKSGNPFILEPGCSICLKPWVYHRFYGEAGSGPVLVGEVSMVNDDNNDNRFYEPLGRFPELIEDEEPVHLLVNDYSNYL